MKSTLRAAAAALAFAAACGAAHAQWALVARKAVGAVRQMTSEPAEGHGGGYDVATVLLEARADLVYRKALELLASNRDVKITRRADSALTVDFTDGRQQAGLQVTALDESLSQLMIATTTSRDDHGAGSKVLSAVLRVCREVGVRCEPAQR